MAKVVQMGMAGRSPMMAATVKKTKKRKGMRTSKKVKGHFGR